MGLVFPEEMFFTNVLWDFYTVESKMSVFLYKLGINHKASNIIINLGFLFFGVPRLFPWFKKKKLINYVFIQQECIKLIKKWLKFLHCKKNKKIENLINCSEQPWSSPLYGCINFHILYYNILYLFIFLDFVLDIQQDVPYCTYT